MNKAVDTLEDALNHYIALQEAQLEAFRNDEHPDIARHHFERNRAFENLKNELTNLLHALNNKRTEDTSREEACRDKLSQIMERDRILTEEVAAYRERLQAQLSRFQHGKRAIQGYGGRPSGTAASRNR
jgi:hypothetical protein